MRLSAKITISALLCCTLLWAQRAVFLAQNQTAAAGGLTVPTFVSATATAYTGTGASVTVTVPTVLTGDLIIVQCAAESGNDAFSTPTASIGTFSAINNAGTGSSTGTGWSTVTATSGGTSVAIAVAVSGSTSDHKGCTASVWEHTNGPGSGTGVFNSVITSSAGSAYTASLTTSGIHSAIVWSCSDFTAGAVGSQAATPTPTATQKSAADGARYTNFVQYLADRASAGAVTVGMGATGTSAGPYNCTAIEVKGQ